MVRKTKIARFSERIMTYRFHPFGKAGRYLLLVAFYFSVTTMLVAQEGDTLAMANNKAQTLKYLRSLSVLEEEQCAKAEFISKYDVDLTSGKEVIMVADSWIKKAPKSKAANCNTLIPLKTVVRIYNYHGRKNYWAVKYKNRWGFVANTSVRRFEEE